MFLICSIQNLTCSGQFSTCPAQNALALASISFPHWGNGLAPIWHQVISWTDDDTYVQSTGSWITFWIFIKKIHLKCCLQNCNHFVQVPMCQHFLRRTWNISGQVNQFNMIPANALALCVTMTSYHKKWHHSRVLLTHCGLVTPYGDMDPGQPWLR